jgi:hypothetical protein
VVTSGVGTNTTAGKNIIAMEQLGSGSKRTRQFTPASARVIDEEDEPRRTSPRARIAGYGGEIADDD